jgi:beta-galactosidase
MEVIMKEHISLNNAWRYNNSFEPEMIKNDYDESRMIPVRLPHTNIETPYNYFDERMYQFVSCYRRKLEVKEEWEGKRILLTFEGVGHIAAVYCNGSKIFTHYGGYTAFTVDLAPHLSFGGGDNVLAVEVDSRESNNLPPFGNVIDYLTYGGIYREAYLDIKEQVSIEDAFIITGDGAEDGITDGSGAAKPRVVSSEETGPKEIELEVTLHGIQAGRQAILQLSLEDPDRKPLYTELLPVTGQTVRHRFSVRGVSDWDIDNPALYYLKLALTAKADGDNLLDEKILRFGFRTCEFKKDGFYLNHRKRKLVGLNRHQSFPYVGYAMPKRMQRRDAEFLKEELHVNAVRTSHYPQSRHFIDRCDELGLLVFTEIPGWQHIGDEDWRKLACENVREMVLQYRNHPSVILWGVRINESQDNDAFYQKTNQIAHELDPSRQTGGVRYLKKSRLLEDVYTYNDFLHNGRTKGLDRKEEVTPDKNAPYMVTEFNGHMFPTKAFDDEEHRLQHALRHARVLDAFFEQEELAGAFGWCMFDYNTHRDFGSGDKVCYHGVMDMFRNPKLAAAVYASQEDKDTVCEISSSMDIGDHPAGNLGEVYVFTNADSIRLYKNDTFIKEFYPDREKYPHLPHPPIIINDFVGDLLEKKEHFGHKTAEAMKEILFAVRDYGQNNLPLKYKLKMAFLMLREHLKLETGVRLYYEYIGSWGGASTAFCFEAVKNHKTVKTIVKKPVSKPRIIAVTGTTGLKEEETYDVSEIRIKAIDEDGNRLPYYQEPVCLEAFGAIGLIGPRTVSLKGGTAGVYVKTLGIKGEGTLRILQEDLGETRITFTVE